MWRSRTGRCAEQVDLRVQSSGWLATMAITGLAVCAVLASGAWHVAHWVGGIRFVTDPSGSTLGMSPRQLPNWPLLVDYTVPGLLLIAMFGTLPMPALVALVRRPELGWPAVAVVGVLLVVWMLVQIFALGLLLPGMQLAFPAIGAVLVALAATSRPRRRP